MYNYSFRSEPTATKQQSKANLLQGRPGSKNATTVMMGLFATIVNG